MSGAILKRTGILLFTLAMASCNTNPSANTVSAPPQPAANDGGNPIKTSASAAPIDCNGKAILACTTSRGKQLRVCNGDGDNLTYRFGAANSEPELELTTKADYAFVPYSGGGEAQIRFFGGETEYIVFSRVARTGFQAEENKPEMIDGVMEIRDGETVTTRLCEGESDSVDINALRDKGPPRSELFTD